MGRIYVRALRLFDVLRVFNLKDLLGFEARPTGFKNPLYGSSGLVSPDVRPEGPSCNRLERKRFRALTEITTLCD